MILIVLLAVLGVTIVFIGRLISVHLFVGLLLLGPVALKMASTGYRFARYYTRAPSYRRKGPPALPLRMIAPVVVVTTMLVFASGIVLLFDGPIADGPWREIHKLSFIVWLAFTALHVVGHLPGLSGSLRAARPRPDLGGGSLGAAGRWIAITGALVGGAVLAIVLISYFAPWTTTA